MRVLIRPLNDFNTLFNNTEKHSNCDIYFLKIRFFTKIWIELIFCNESIKILVNILYVFFPASHRLKKSLKSNAQILRELGHHCGCGDEIYKLRMIRKQSVSEIFGLVTQSPKASVFSLMV